jgi:hypothetical protein
MRFGDAAGTPSTVSDIEPKDQSDVEPGAHKDSRSAVYGKKKWINGSDFLPPPESPTKEGEILARPKEGRIRVNSAGPIVPRLQYQGKSRCLSAPIHDFMVAGRFALV